MLDKIKSLSLPLIAALISGVALSLCFPGWGISGFVWVWMLPLLPAIWRGERKRYGFGIGYVAGLVFWLLNLKWLWVVSGLGAMAMAGFLALYFGVWGAFAVSVGNPWRKRHSPRDAQSGIQQKIAKKLSGEKKGVLGGALSDSLTSLKFAFINAAAWVGLEWLRGWILTGFSWNGLGAAFYETPVMAQAADLVGVTGLAFTPVFMSVVLVQTGRRLLSEVNEGRLRPRLDFSVAALLLAAQFCYGVLRMREVNRWETQRVRVLLIQENIPQTLKWDPKVAASILQGYADSTAAAMKVLEDENLARLKENPGDEPTELKRPDIVIWPESAMPNPLLYIEGEEGYLLYGDVRHLIEKEIRPLGAGTLIAGMNEFEGERDANMLRWKKGGGQYNSMAVVSPEGDLAQSIQTYRKMHLVIFGEYIPFLEQLPFLGELFKFSSGADFAGGFSAGTSTEPIPIATAEGEVEIIPTICFEDGVGRLTRKFVRAKPQLIVNVTNDGWFKESEAAIQHMANAKFRAIELRRPMVRCANTGVSGVISATGSYVDAVSKRRQIIEDDAGSPFIKSSLYGYAYVPKHGPLTLYALVGDAFSYLMMLVAGLSIVRHQISNTN